MAASDRHDEGAASSNDNALYLYITLTLLSYPLRFAVLLKEALVLIF